MKKLLIIITLFLSSFFFISLKEAKAYEYTKEVNFSLMEDVLSLKEKLDAFVETDTRYSDYYIITFNGNSFTYYIFPLDSSLEFTFNSSSNYFGFIFNSTIKYGSNLSNISFSYTVASKQFFLTHNDNSMEILCFSNFNFYFSNVSLIQLSYIYSDFNYIYYTENGKKVLSLYDIYLEYQEYLGNADLEHKEEIEKVENFYNVVIEKLSYLAEEIVSNYIYLSIIVIFILIFVFLLIFRRHL